MSIEKVSGALQDFDKLKNKTKGFEDVLRKIEHADAKKKILWKEIYENANLDRQNAHVLFVEAYTAMSQGTTEHAVLGATLSKYIERMNKANDQLIKLAELMNKSESEYSQINSDDLFSQIQD
jgi:hypothetical protein|tara:strand:- start:322 stop:690 length:369 start_codon:yes stop_codon:yes gene_type:complete